jgi:hypothetical protein
VVHLESGEDVLIMRGTAEDLGAPSSAPPVIAALAVKYTGPEDRQYLPSVDPDFDVLYAIRPRSAMTWRLDNYAPCAAGRPDDRAARQRRACSVWGCRG